jgi:hypothetical protein
MLNEEEIKKYVRLYKFILNQHQIVISDQNLDQIYQLIVLLSKLDDLYDSVDQSPSKAELEKIKKGMTSLMPNRHPIALNAIELVFKAMDEEAHFDLSQSLSYYLRICGKSTGAQLITGYLASKNCIQPRVWFSKTFVKFNDEINDLVRLANDYLDTTVDARRTSEESFQVKAMNFFRCQLQFKIYLYYRYIVHKLRYYLYLVSLKYLKFSSSWRDYVVAIHCSESVLDLAVKAYVTDKNSGRI